MTESPVILFDGVCNLCNRSVQRVLKNEKSDYYKFASLQSEFGQNVLKELGKNQSEFESFLVLENDKVYEKSRAVYKVIGKLKFPYALLYFFWPIPWFMRDWVYTWIARNRYKWYGKREECWLPDEKLKARFID